MNRERSIQAIWIIFVIITSVLIIIFIKEERLLVLALWLIFGISLMVVTELYIRIQHNIEKRTEKSIEKIIIKKMNNNLENVQILQEKIIQLLESIISRRSRK